VAKEIPAGSTDPWLEALAFHLLRKHAATEGDAALESDSGKIGATAALRFCPGTHRRNHARQRRAQEIQKAKVSTDRLDAAAVFRALRTELQELHDAREVFTGSSPGDARDVRTSGDRASFADAAMSERQYHTKNCSSVTTEQTKMKAAIIAAPPRAGRSDAGIFRNRQKA